MIVIICAIAGACIGGMLARQRKGRVADILQYAFVYMLIFALIGLFATLIIDRTML